MKKILFSALIALALFALPVQAQVTSKINSQSAQLVDGNFVVKGNYDLDSTTAAILQTDPFSLYATNKTFSVPYSFNNVDTNNYATFKLYKPVVGTGSFVDIKLYGLFNSLTDTVCVDTLQLLNTIGSAADTSGLLEFNSRKFAEKYFLVIKAGKAGGRDIDNGTYEIVFRKPQVLR